MDALKEEQDNVLYNRDELKKYDLVFCDRRYKLSTNYGLNKCLKVFLSELGIGSQTMIATAGRYIYGSYLLSKGVDIWAVSRLLILFENQIQTTSASPCRTQVQPAASFLVCSLIFIEYKA